MAGKLYIVGVGPGHHDHMTFRAKQVIEESDTIVGYTTYVNLVENLIDGKDVYRYAMTQEVERAQQCIDLAKEGKIVSLVSSGDPGIYGMAGLIYETLAESGWNPKTGLQVEIIPGVSALNSCASLIGSPLMTDFAVVSMSDLLVPWEIIVKRVEAAAQGDFVIVIYNPSSKKRIRQLQDTRKITQAHCDVCAVNFSEVKNIVNKYLDRETKIISLEPNTLNDVFNDIKRVAKDLNIENETNNKLINNLKIRIEKIKNLAATKKQRPLVACIEWIDPLMIAGNWIPEMVEIAGGTNILGKSGVNSHWIKFEEIIDQNPEIIIFMPCGFNIEKTKKELDNYIKKNNSLRSLKAYKNHKLFVADGNQFFNRPGPRLIESLEIFAEIIHPNIFDFEHKGIGWINYND